MSNEKYGELKTTWNALYYKFAPVWEAIDETFIYKDDDAEELQRKIDLFNEIYPYLCQEY